MDVTTLIQLGLTESQAKTYLALLDSGSAAPPEISNKTGEKRSNTYKLLDKLCELGLASKEEIDKKLTYFPNSPAALEQIIQENLDTAASRQRKLKASLPGMLEEFHKQTERPGIRFFQGREGLEKIYDDTLAEGEDIYLVRSPYDVNVMSDTYLKKYKRDRARLKLTTHMISPDVANATHDEFDDKLHRIKRTWLPKGSYDAAVEINIYGDKVALISFGNEVMGMIIESPQIAKAIKQLYFLARAGEIRQS